jgi:hypothetical protein
MKNFVPDNFMVPEVLITKHYRLEVLSPAVAEIDYEAVMSSRQRLRNVFAENDKWPRDEMTLADNINDLKRHEEEFQRREAFAYTVLNHNRDRCIGCVYIDPPTVELYDCEIYLWVRDSDLRLDIDLYENVLMWIDKDWPFKNAAFPGRLISWSEWKKIK